MTELVYLPLDSLRLAHYASQSPCAICSGSNCLDAERCRHCHAPMALGRHPKGKKNGQAMIAVLGPSGVGKTLYLGMLFDMLARSPDRMQALARGAFSLSLQQTVAASLARCECPPPTVMDPALWNWVHCQIRVQHQRWPLDLVVPDFSGDALMHEVHHPYSFIGIRAYLAKCVGLMILIDAAQLDQQASEQDYLTTKMLSYIAELSAGGPPARRQFPVAVVFTKSDQCAPCVTDPSGFAARHAPGAMRYLQQCSSSHRCFATSVSSTWVRRAPHISTPLRIEPRGILEPFQWLTSCLKSKA